MNYESKQKILEYLSAFIMALEIFYTYYFSKNMITNGIMLSCLMMCCTLIIFRRGEAE